MCDNVRCIIPQSVLCQLFRIPGLIHNIPGMMVFKKERKNDSNMMFLERKVAPCINQMWNESDVFGTYGSTNLPILIITFTIVTVCAKCCPTSAKCGM